MANPPTTLTPAEQITALQQLTDATTVAANAQGSFASILGEAQNSLKSLLDIAKDTGVSLNNLGNTAAAQTDKFGILSAGVIKARDNFQSFGAIDLKNIPTFSGHLADLRQALASGGTAAATATKAIYDLTTRLQNAGVAQHLIAEAAKRGAEGLANLASNIMANADNALKMQASFIGLSAQTGNLGVVYEKAGTNLTNMNSIMDTQNAMIDRSQAATNSNVEQITSYYMALGKVPKALEEVVSSGTQAGGTMSMLTATIKLAHGTGRNYEDVVKDLHQSFKDYGLVGETALRFTARFSELSNTLGVELEDMRGGLLGATSAFKDLTDAGVAAHNMTEGISGIMKDYISGLRESGMTGAHAIETVKNMASAMAGLKVEQRAFLSGQTGGPGGLMGAAQIEKMIRSGDIEGVQKKVMETLKKQFGKIVTLDEATQSEGAAAQRQKQVMLLQQGPLGAMAKTPEDAGRLLDSMAKGKIGKEGAAGLDTKGLTKAIDAGTSMEEKSHTIMSVISSDISAIRHRMEIANLGTIQKAFTTSSGSPDTAVGATARMREGLKGRMTVDAQKSGELTGTYGMQMRTKGAEVADKRGEHTKNYIESIGDSVKKIPDTLKSAYEIFTTGDKKSDKDNSIFKLPTSSSLDPRDPNFGRVSSGAVVGAAPRAKIPAPAATTQSASAPEVIVHRDANSGKFKIDVSVKVDELGSQANSVTPVPTP